MVYYWISWIAITYLLLVDRKKNDLTYLFLWLVLLNILFIEIEVECLQFKLTLPYLYTLIIFWLLILIKKMTYFNYLLLFCLIMIYNGIKYILITNPIWIFFNETMMISCVIIIILLLLVQDSIDRIYLLITSCLTGELLYAFQVKVFDWQVTIGEINFFTSIYLAIIICYLVQWLFSRRILARI